MLDAVQVLAWGRMFAGYATTMDVAAALQKTFDPAKPCRMCLSVAAAKRTAREQLPQNVERSAEKLVLAVHRPAPLVFVPDPGEWPATSAHFAPSRVDPVPLPPPRV